jgi:O-antigen ligase
MSAILLGLFVLGFALGQLGGATLFLNARVYALDAAVGLLLFYCAFRQNNKRRSIPSLWLPILAFAALDAVSVVINSGAVPQAAQAVGLLYLVRWLFYAALYWAAASNAITIKSWIRVLYSAGVAVALLGLVQFAWYPNLRNLYYLGWDPHFQRLFSTLLDPNFTGIVLVMALAVGMRLWQEYKKRRGILVAGQTLLFAALLLTYSRSTYLALIVAGVVIALFSVRLRKVLGVLAVVFFMFLIFLPKTGEGQNLLREASVMARVENLKAGLGLFAGSPIVGYGFNTLRYLPRAQSLEDLRTAGGESIPSRSAGGFDMSVVFVAATGGIVGVALYIWLLVRMAVLGRKNMYFLAALAAVVVHSLFVNTLFYPWVMAFVWIWTGVVEREAA